MDARPSAAEKERVARRLRCAAADERLSTDTFAARLELVYGARSEVDLRRAVADLPDESALTRVSVALVARAAGLRERVERAWRDGRAPLLLLPQSRRVVVGRSRGCDVTVGDPGVSRRHAELSPEGDRWLLRDLGSTNGTTVNGARVSETVEVGPGDVVRFGTLAFRLAAPHPLR